MISIPRTEGRGQDLKFCATNEKFIPLLNDFGLTDHLLFSINL